MRRQRKHIIWTLKAYPGGELFTKVSIFSNFETYITDTFSNLSFLVSNPFESEVCQFQQIGYTSCHTQEIWNIWVLALHLVEASLTIKIIKSNILKCCYVSIFTLHYLYWLIGILANIQSPHNLNGHVPKWSTCRYWETDSNTS